MSEAVINDALARMNEPEVKDRLKATTQEALDLGVSNLTCEATYTYLILGCIHS